MFRKQLDSDGSERKRYRLLGCDAAGSRTFGGV